MDLLLDSYILRQRQMATVLLLIAHIENKAILIFNYITLENKQLN
jgi:hypothetical protein